MNEGHSIQPQVSCEVDFTGYSSIFTEIPVWKDTAHKHEVEWDIWVDQIREISKMCTV